MAITDTYENEPRAYPGQQDAALDVLLSLSTPAASIHELPELPDRTHGGGHRLRSRQAASVPSRQSRRNSTQSSSRT